MRRARRPASANSAAAAGAAGEGRCGGWSIPWMDGTKSDNGELGRKDEGSLKDL